MVWPLRLDMSWSDHWYNTWSDHWYTSMAIESTSINRKSNWICHLLKQLALILLTKYMFAKCRGRSMDVLCVLIHVAIVLPTKAFVYLIKSQRSIKSISTFYAKRNLMKFETRGAPMLYYTSSAWIS